ncbi:alpha/beta hydrolase family protein [Mucilaginibacter sp. AK015]|uniref:alpha/beta hydrolase n=1 Tax=Mucilaginibacter sp. AK015 TaxID=2723072 RepID=UPI00161EBE6B|nr:alpha/beta hydrolase family protein [Mucilaginibacter sp. AK015]MBB5394092.1 S-formylglutathione hydrolase FrmB [Mucilaginibacter sp. AK015]
MNTKKTIALLLLCATTFVLKANAATIDTALTHSAAMNKDLKAVVIKPADYSAEKKYPVLYLLHGFSGKYSDWIKKVPTISQLADNYHMLIVCPDGNFAGWYFDSPMNKEWMYETYIANELVSYIDKHYATITNRKGRAITGLSMGGHGAFFLAFKHQDIFGAAGSMSGVVDIRQFADSYGIEQVLGKYSEHPDVWEQHCVVSLIYLLKPDSLALTFDCGYDDGMYSGNQELHEKLLERKIPHDYTVRPGGHSWEYWANAVNYQALFFSRYFNNKR